MELVVDAEHVLVALLLSLDYSKANVSPRRAQHDGLTRNMNQGFQSIPRCSR